MSRTDSRPAQAMVLAAGLGERMRPLSEGRAKPALVLMNRPIILRVLDHLASQGIERAVVNLHHRPEGIRALVESGAPRGLTVLFAHEAVILGTAGGLRAARAHLDFERPVLVVNADSFLRFDLGALAAAHEAGASSFQAPATLVLRRRAEGETYTPVHLDPEGRIAGIGAAGERGEPTTFLGAHILAPEAIARIPGSGPSDLVRDVYLPLLREGRRLGAHLHRGFWVEIGNPALYLGAHMALLRDPEFMKSIESSAGRVIPASPPSILGPAAILGAGVVVEGSVIGPGCRLHEGAAVVRSVVGAGATLGAGARVEGCVIDEGVDIPPDARVTDRLLVPASPAGGEPQAPSAREPHVEGASWAERGERGRYREVPLR